MCERGAVGAAGATTLIQQLANSRAGCADVRTPTPNKGWRVGPAEAVASNGVAASHPYAAADVVTAWNKLTACSTLTLSLCQRAIYVPAQRNIRLQNYVHTLFAANVIIMEHLKRNLIYLLIPLLVRAVSCLVLCDRESFLRSLAL